MLYYYWMTKRLPHENVSPTTILYTLPKINSVDLKVIKVHKENAFTAVYLKNTILLIIASRSPTNIQNGTKMLYFR